MLAWSLLPSGGDAPCRLLVQTEFFHLLFGQSLRRLQDADRVFDILVAMVGHHLHADTRLPLRDRGEFDQVGDEAKVRQTAGDQAGEPFSKPLLSA